MKPEQVREAVLAILLDEVKWEGPVPRGPLDRHLDSLQRMSLIVAIEDRFHICFEPEDEETIVDFEDLVRTIASKTVEAA